MIAVEKYPKFPELYPLIDIYGWSLNVSRRPSDNYTSTWRSYDGRSCAKSHPSMGYPSLESVARLWMPVLLTPTTGLVKRMFTGKKIFSPSLIILHCILLRHTERHSEWNGRVVPHRELKRRRGLKTQSFSVKNEDVETFGSREKFSTSDSSIRIPRFALRPSNPHIVPTTFARLIGISRILISPMFITRRNHDEYFLDNRVKIRCGN